MKKLAILLLLSVFGCNKKPTENKIETQQTDTVQFKPAYKTAEAIPEKLYSETEIEIDLQGNGNKTKASLQQIKEQVGNPLEDGTPAEYIIKFDNANIPSLNIGCCAAKLINEGDLNNDGNEELSIYQEPMNGCTYTMTTYTFKNGEWKQLIPPFLIPTACEEIPLDEIKKRVFQEKNKIYIYQTDINDENLKLIKTEAKLQ
ncbi:hypothetical protein [Flavobacterium cerinum]|uniref:Uncharacterized protein n=1 Tax=Flavobacterium cerinum TaxID=2502784 RepID=A0A3S4SWB2_9FLAO|nr:hypothetical protein [Flavobacterium cerinum]RWW93825.1 hypothetical protein EPI11_14925 [Flavobacterium cerinum]